MHEYKKKEKSNQRGMNIKKREEQLTRYEYKRKRKKTR